MYRMYKTAEGMKFYKNSFDQYKFDKYEVGEFFEVTLDQVKSVRSACQYYEKKTGKIFRVVVFSDEKLARCGRMK